MNSQVAPIVTLDEASHVYTHRDGFRPPSVTQILTAVPPFAGVFDRVDPATLEYARQRGTQVHRATHFYDEDTLDAASVDPALVPYLDAWASFRAQSGFQPELMETAVFHPSYGYAGTLDRVGVVPNTQTHVWQRVILDIKTGASEMAGPQTAAYLEAVRALYPHYDANVQRWTVQLHATGRYTITVHASRRDWRFFLAALEIFTYCRGAKS